MGAEEGLFVLALVGGYLVVSLGISCCSARLCNGYSGADDGGGGLILMGSRDAICI